MNTTYTTPPQFVTRYGKTDHSQFFMKINFLVDAEFTVEFNGPGFKKVPRPKDCTWVTRVSVYNFSRNGSFCTYIAQHSMFPPCGYDFAGKDGTECQYSIEEKISRLYAS